MLHAGCVQLSQWYERPFCDITLHVENLVDLVFGSQAKCSAIFYQEAAPSRMGIAALAEIFAIVLGGGGGLVLADALLRPGRRSRIQALRDRGRRALSLVGAAVPLLVIAGLIEGFVTPMAILPPVGKLVFAAVAAVGIAAARAALAAPKFLKNLQPAPTTTMSRFHFGDSLHPCAMRKR